MNFENVWAKPKPPEKLEAQLSQAESAMGKKLMPDEERARALELPIAELQEKYPDEYAKYVAFLRFSRKPVKPEENAEVPTYLPDELAHIRASLAGESKIGEEMLGKLGHDTNVRTYSMVVMFPEIYERVYKRGEKPDVSTLGIRQREKGLKVTFSDAAYVVKTLENEHEPKVARIAGEIGIGPKQFDSVKHYLTEEFIDGPLIAKLESARATPDFMENLGRQVAEAVRNAHSHNIVINDQLLRDDFGKSHTVVTAEGKIRFIDFGASVDVSEYPDLTDTQAYALMRTDAFAAFTLVGMEGKKLLEKIARYREDLLQTFPTKEDLMKGRDYQLLHEGIGFLSQAVPNVKYFAQGLEAVLQAKHV